MLIGKPVNKTIKVLFGGIARSVNGIVLPASKAVGYAL
jgi:hypothetical protein